MREIEPNGYLSRRVLLASAGVAVSIYAFQGLNAIVSAQESGQAPRIRAGSWGRADFRFFSNLANPYPGIAYDVLIGTAVVAPAKGRVSRVGETDRWGTRNYFVWLNHGYGYSSLLGQLSKALVSPTQEVKRGELIGHSGAFGVNRISGPTMVEQLYFAILKKGKAVDPEKMGAGGKPPTYWDGKTELDASEEDGTSADLFRLVWSNYKMQDPDPLGLKEIVEKKKSVTLAAIISLLTTHSAMFDPETLDQYRAGILKHMEEKAIVFSAPIGLR